MNVKISRGKLLWNKMLLKNSSGGTKEYSKTEVRKRDFMQVSKSETCRYNSSRDSVIGIATGYGLDDRGVGVRVPVESRIFSSPRCPDRSGVRPTSYPMGTGGSFPRVKRLGREADHSPPTSAEVKKMWIYTSTPPYAFMA
jgi:hypothetical protein